MPFVPLSQRKPIPLVLDADKEAIAARQRERDNAAVQRHVGAAPGASGYRFANHPQTFVFGQVRGPDVPFRQATSPWRPPSADPDGPAQRRDEEQAKYGAYWESSHALRKVRSTPALESPTSAANAVEACHPLSMELRRWEKLAARTRRSDMQGMEDVEFEFPRKQQTAEPEPPRGPPVRQGLIMFPKYMLINNCHLKQTDLQKFQREQAEEQRRLAEEAEHLRNTSPSSFMDSQESMVLTHTRPGPVRFEASWGQPKLKEQLVGGPHWAGSGLPAGRSMRTSNPFRMG